ncbi:uncharacterized protein LACBIDRAFT_298829 [Laccaria bicolor S238N-H82]|uniref:Predicted protein n=1 Tax=Laccaria bicolor (strain S238N-H82 / ATCC MYA-4686) TaxID=486041 RepID=B0E3I6_LACBS|nr:uncharacterized protein LACBIDRAFT_298829 [Laccaria bicolor S238N-H82]EDQ98595.1 predicted protein [Laccaria bicolor S238N-H82]|eukprot:XP_001890756.1 predicted protein [Laccaria bicolor S238N-H82]
MLHTQPLSYAQRAKNAQNKSNHGDDSPPTSPTLAVKALSIVAAQKDTTIVNFWSQRKEKMAAAAAAAATHPNPQQQLRKTVPSRDNTTTNGVDTNTWPEVGKVLESASGTTTDEQQEREKENVSHTPRKTKWVPIPPEELQAAADALRVKSAKSSRSNSRSNNKRNTTNANANGSTQNQNQNQSGRQSTPASTSHSRVNSRSASVHSSPHLFARGRRLPDDQDHSVPPVPTLNGTNANGGGMKAITTTKDDAYRPYQPQPYLPSPITITRNTSTGSPTYPYPYPHPNYPGPAFEYPSAGSSTIPTPHTMPVPQPYWFHPNPNPSSGQHSPNYPPQGMYSMPQPHASGRKPPEHAAPVVVYGYDVSTPGNGKKAMRGAGPVVFGSIASAQEVTPSPSPGPSMPVPVNVPVPVNGGLAIDELGVRRITTRHGGVEQRGVLNGVGKWEFGTTGLTSTTGLDDHQPQEEKLEDNNVPLKTNTNGIAESKPSSGSVSPLVGLGVGLDAFSVKYFVFGFVFGLRRANVSGVGGGVMKMMRVGKGSGEVGYKLLESTQAIANKHPESTQFVLVSINQRQERSSQCSSSQPAQQPLQAPSLQVPFNMAMKQRLPNEVMSVVLRALYNSYRHLSLRI